MIYVLFACFLNSGCITYEFKDKIQCENALKISSKKGPVQMIYCLEVRKAP
jgi:hypothetical protein